MSDQPKWTVREEVTEVLKRRRTIEQQYKRISSFYSKQIQEKCSKFNVPEDLVISAYYLAREIMAEVGTPHKYAADVATFQMEILSDDARVELIIDTLIEARKYYGGKKIEEIASYYQLIHDISMKIFKSYVIQKRMHILERVIICTVTDSYLNPMFNFFKELIPRMDFRWLIAEIEAFLRKDFPKAYYLEVIKEFPESSFNEELFFEAGAWIIKRYIEWVAKLADEKEVKQLQDVGQTSYVYALSTFYKIDENKLITEPKPTNKEGIEDKAKLIDLSEKLLIVNKEIVNKSPYKLKYGKIQLNIEEEKGTGKTVRHSFIINEEYENIGAWQRLLLAVEDVNSSLLSTYLHERCKNLKGAINLIEGKANKISELFDVPSIQYWDEAMINYTQEGQDHIVVEDVFANMQYIPITLTDFSNNSYKILLRKKRTHHVTELSGGQNFIEFDDFKIMLELVDMITGLLFEEATMVTKGDRNFKITAFPEEMLFINKNDPENMILGLFGYDEDSDVLVGLFSKDYKQSESRTAIAKRTINSKINQILSGMHVKSFLETVDMKMTEETITSNNSRLFEVSDTNHSCIYRGNVSESGIIYDKSSDKIESAFEEALNQEQAELKNLQDNYFESIIVTGLIKLITLKLNEILLLGSQKENNLTKIQFDKLFSSLNRQLKSLKQEYGKEVPPQILEIFEKLIEDLDKKLNEIDFQTRSALEKAKAEVKKMAKEDIQNIINK